ncbi:MAG: polyribonucleotide nucleotidyltransferase, partial [Acidobacteria bacterium]|nr:polyribonucleotide nucleotidyltransferase [Acidobacteriota bacterium]
MAQRKYLNEKIKLGDKELMVETGKVAKQADGAVVVRYGDTMILVTAVSARTAKEGLDFFPLTVEYRESTYSAGRIPGNYFRREGRPNEKEVLTCRMIDRPVRPLFPEGYRFETQIVGSVISADLENDPDVIAMTGASLALY